MFVPTIMLFSPFPAAKGPHCVYRAPACAAHGMLPPAYTAAPTLAHGRIIILNNNTIKMSHTILLLLPLFLPLRGCIVFIARLHVRRTACCPLPTQPRPLSVTAELLY